MKHSRLSVHGRFQPVLHLNHWNYIKYAFDSAEHVTIYITNPDRDESHEETASWRSNPENNPFSYEQREAMFHAFFSAKGVKPNRYAIKPLNIKDPKSIASIDKHSPMVVNVYSDWSAKKVELFDAAGVSTVVIRQQKIDGISGTKIRKVLAEDGEGQDEKLLQAGIMLEALDGLKAFVNR